MKKRASYFFVLDVFIASAIMVLTLVIIFSSRANAPPPETSYLMAEDFMDFLATTEFRDTGHSMKYGLVNKSIIKDSSMSLLQVIAYLNYCEEVPLSCPEWPDNKRTDDFIEELATGLIPEVYSVSYNISGIDGALYTRPSNSVLSNAFIILSARRVTYFRLDNDDLYGPVISEVTVWS